MLESIFTNELLAEIQSYGNQKFVDDPVVVCKLYIPWKVRTACVFNYDPSNQEFSWIFFDGYEESYGEYGLLPHEWREFRLDFLQERAKTLWVTILQDKQFKPCRVSELHLGL